MADFKSRSIPFYLDSARMASTQEKMAKMTPEELAHADAVFALAEENYENGGDYIVECAQPWDIAKWYPTLDDAREYMGLIHDYAEDIRNA